MHIFMLMDVFQDIKLTKQNSNINAVPSSTQQRTCTQHKKDLTERATQESQIVKKLKKIFFLNLLFSGLTEVQFYEQIALHSLHTPSEDLCQNDPLS